MPCTVFWFLSFQSRVLRKGSVYTLRRRTMAAEVRQMVTAEATFTRITTLGSPDGFSDLSARSKILIISCPLRPIYTMMT